MNPSGGHRVHFHADSFELGSLRPLSPLDHGLVTSKHPSLIPKAVGSGAQSFNHH